MPARQPSKPIEAKSVTGGPPAAPPEALRTSKKSVVSPSKAAPEPASLEPASEVVVEPTEEATPETPGAPAPAAARRRKRARKREIPRGPSKLTLSILAAATILALGGAAALLGLIPSPLARPLASAVAGGMVHPVPAHPMPQPKPPSMPAAANPPEKPVSAKPAAAKLPEANAQPAAAEMPEASASPVATPTAASIASAVAQPVRQAPAAHPVASAPAASAAPAHGASTVEPNEDGAGGDASQALLASARKKLADDDATGAEALIRQALAKDPQDHHAMELLVHALMDQDRGADAVPYARKIVQRRPRRVTYRLLLGDLLLMVGKEAEARSEWGEALKLAPNDPQIKRRLGQ
jgi:Flp pilus assembly protein TadD